MKIKFIAYEAKRPRKTKRTSQCCASKLDKKAGKNGRSLDEINKHKKHYSKTKTRQT